MSNRTGFRTLALTFIRRPLGAFAVLTMLLMIFCALFADVVATRDPSAQFRGSELAPPGAIARDGQPLLLGGDDLARDIFSRVVHGARISLYVGLLSVAGAVLIGTAAGLVAGYFGGAWDALIERAVEIFMSIPVIVLAMVIATILGAGINGVILAVLVIQWPRVARVVRGDVLVVRALPYVEAARSIGAGNMRILTHHVLRNVTTSLIIIATTNLGAAVTIEAALAFLGIGAVPPTPAWGLMIADARPYLTRDPKLMLIPGIAISMVVLAFNLGGDVLRDVLDPRMTETKRVRAS